MINFNTDLKDTTNATKQNTHESLPSTDLADNPDFVCCFFNAIREGSFSKVQQLLSTPMININVRDEQGMTGLCIASQQGYANIIELLLLNKANINKTDCYGRTPLLISTINKRNDIVALLLNQGADPDLLCHENVSPLSFAITHNDYKMMELLLKHKANPNQILRIAQKPYSHCQGHCLLNFTTIYDNQVMFRILLQYGASLDTVDISKLTSFDYVARVGSAKIIKEVWKKLDDRAKVKFIIATIEHRNYHGFHYALEHSSNEIRQNVFQTEINGIKPIYYVVQNNCPSFCNLLLEYGAELIEKVKPDDCIEMQRTKALHMKTLQCKVGNKKWHAILARYFAKMIEFESTPTLVELAINVVNKLATQDNKIFEDLNFPPELYNIYHQAPINFINRSKHLKPMHVREFLESALHNSQESIKELKNEEKKFKRQKVDK